MGIITPEELAASGTEHAHQAALMQWVAVEGVDICGEALRTLYAIPNGGNYGGNRAAGSRMKAEGLKSGVPDLHWPYPVVIKGQEFLDRMYHGLWIEMKKPGLESSKNGGCSDKQLIWHERLRRQGHAVCVAYGWQAARLCIWWYANGELLMPREMDRALKVDANGWLDY